MKKLISLLLLLLISGMHLEAILDGRLAPIVLSTTYTFTDYEWARGEVYFNRGFTVPCGTTAILGIDVPVLGNVLYSAGASTRDQMSTLILEKPLALRGGNQGGCKFKTQNGYQGIVRGLFEFGDVFIIDGDVTFDGEFGFWHFVYPHNTSGPNQQPGFLLDSATTSTLRIINDTYVNTEDLGKPFIMGLNPGVRHKVILENTQLLFTTNMTFTNVDLIIGQGTTRLYGNVGTNINVYGQFAINDFGILQLSPRVNLNLKPSIVGDDYFDIAPYGQLFLTHNTLTFTRALKIPQRLPGKNTYGGLVVDGMCSIKALNVGDESILQLGAGPHLTYTYDGLLDIQAFSSLQLQKVKLVNNNFTL